MMQFHIHSFQMRLRTKATHTARLIDAYVYHNHNHNHNHNNHNNNYNNNV